MSKFFYSSSVIIIVAAAVLLLWFYYILFWPMTVLKPNIQPYKVLTPVVKIGSNLTYQVDACKSKVLHAEVTRTFEDGVGYPGISAENNIPMGCHKTNITVPVPNYIIPGEYHLKLDASYQINAFRTEEYTFITQTFQVIK